jgi:hypothetical protein
MEIFYQVLSVIGIAGIVAVGIWVGTIQTKINNHDEDSALIKSDHDLFTAKISSHDEIMTSVKADHALLMSDHDILIRVDEKMNLVLKKLGI